MDSSDQAKLQLRNNPLFIITIACIVAALLSTVGFLLYYNSDTRKTVEQIQKNNAELGLKKQSSDIDTSKPGDAQLKEIEIKISTDIDAHSDEAEFNAAELTDSALGL